MRLATNTETEIASIKTKINELEGIDEKRKEDAKKISEYQEQIKGLLDLNKPNRELIKTLVDKILIDKDKNIEIIYRFKVLENAKINLNDVI